MSKAAKQSILILIVLLMGAVLFAGKSLLDKQTVEQSKSDLQKQLEDAEARTKEMINKTVELENKLKSAEEARAKVQEQLDGIDNNIDGFKQQIADLTAQRETWLQQLEEAQQERDRLAQELQSRGSSVTAGGGDDLSAAPYVPGASDDLTVNTSEVTMAVRDDFYWASVLKEKSALELTIEKLKSDLKKSAVEIVELKKHNSDMQLELNNVTSTKQELQRKFEEGQELADSLSLELARAHNDKKYFAGRAEKLESENANLQQQIKRLTSTKIALEKSIVRLEEEKKGVEKKLLQTENVIQSRIDEIWEIKDNLEKEFQPTAKMNGNEVELPPIVVTAESDGIVTEIKGKRDLENPKGSILSVNDENNFVIVDLGQTTGLQLGDNLAVYRGAEYIAGLEVIQLREDIAAADIKSKITDIKIGDAVR